VCLKMTNEGREISTSRPGRRLFGVALGGNNRAYLDLHLECMIERTQRRTPRLCSSEFRDSFRGGN